MSRYTLLIVVAAVVAGCANLAPLYQRPAPPVPDQWPSGPAYTRSANRPGDTDVDWHDFVLDPRLQQIIALALANNRDLRVTALTIEKTQAQYQIEQSLLFPRINANASASAALTPADLSVTGKRQVSRNYNIGLGFSTYEIDFFGRVRNLKDEALQQYLASEAAHRSLQITLIAQIAGAYLMLAADQGHLALAQDTLKNQQAAFALSKRRFDLGVTSQLDLSQVQTLVDTARGDVARYTSIVAQDVNALNLLAGVTIPDELLPSSSVTGVTAIRDLPAGLPGELLQNRPDILEAEHNLQAAHADIGVARAAFFPSITLTSSIGTASKQLSGLFTAGSRAWVFAPQLNLPIFNAGSNIATLKVSEANRKIYLAQYEKAIQSAFREIADALANQGTLGSQLEAQQSLVDATALNFKLSDARFQRGVDSYLVVLDAQRSLYAAQQNLISLKLAQATSQVTLYKALGGGAPPPANAGLSVSGNNAPQ